MSDDNIETYLENNTSLRFIPLGTAAFYGGRFLRIAFFCGINITGYILRIICNQNIPGLNPTTGQTPAQYKAQVGSFITLYTVSNSLTTAGGFILVICLIWLLRTWVMAVTHTRGLRFMALVLLTMVGLGLTIVGASIYSNPLRVAGNIINLVLTVLLMVAIAYYHREFKRDPQFQQDVDRSRGNVIEKPSSIPFIPHPFDVQYIMLVCAFIMILRQSYKVAQSAVTDLSSAALKSEAVLFIFDPVLQIIVLLILVISWGPVFHDTIYKKQLELREQARGPVNADTTA
ncbi:hypothetical protein BZG36_00622 [Bifiguratus adelaidae]|uniref:Uncharacterized protein n=1 Tax=Bifiguratus adelaidae TaxID=1938954 RepID=A0A261Y7I9_9FUNG|nr:hypothetical protein BZG36_00622 [Bifiguratus adelaidae]